MHGSVHREPGLSLISRSARPARVLCSPHAIAVFAPALFGAQRQILTPMTTNTNARKDNPKWPGTLVVDSVEDVTEESEVPKNRAITAPPEFAAKNVTRCVCAYGHVVYAPMGMVCMRLWAWCI